MTLAIHQLLQTRPLNHNAIQNFLNKHTFPLIEDRQATFVYHGAADRVLLRHWIYGLASSLAFTRIEHTNLWYIALELPEGSRVEYKFEVHRGNDSAWIRDPLNPHLAHDPFGANSVCQGPGYEAPDWIEPDKEARLGTLEEVHFQHTSYGVPKTIPLYLPAGYRSSRRYPLLVVHDGSDYLKYTKMKTVLDNLIHHREIAPMIVAFSDPGDRLLEYPDHPPHAEFIVHQLVPFLEARYPLFGTPKQRCLMGASFGAVASLSVAWRNPGFFGKLLLQSGSFAFTDIGDHQRGPAFDPVVKFMNAFRENPGKPSDEIFMSCGVYESLIYENRSMLPRLREAGMKVRYVEAHDGHNWENWRDRLRVGLSWLFPGLLWMVYD